MDTLTYAMTPDHIRALAQADALNKTKQLPYPPGSQYDDPEFMKYLDYCRMPRERFALHTIKLVNFNAGQYSPAVLDSLAMTVFHPGCDYRSDLKRTHPGLFNGELEGEDRPKAINASIHACCKRYEIDMYAGLVQPQFAISTKGLFRLLLTSIKRDIFAIFTPK